MIVSIIGLGLIGGSLAISIRENEFAKRIIGVDSSNKNAEDALAIRLVDEITNIETAVPLADLVIIAVPVDQTKLILPKILDY